ncbi:hypothetical protein CLAIMM_05675 [Cladophialophora immunda]|nr:hypothetical protein CLAIMM_05675 [Cladophialophora immunda]
MAEASKDPSFANRTVIVTGAGGSIGKPLCVAFAKAGANVIANDYGCSTAGQGSSSAPAAQVVAEIVAQGLSAVADTHDVARDADKIVALAIERFKRLDIIVNNAGIITYGPVEAQEPEDIRRVFEVNALGAIALCHYAWPHMQKQKYGRIINFTSDSVFGMPSSTGYVLSRGAMLGVTKTLALEGQPHNILVNTIGPSAYSRMVLDVIQDLPPDQQEGFKSTFTGESNIPPLLALASEENTYTGQIWSSGNYAMGRTILATVREVKKLRTARDCLAAMTELMDKDRPWTEPRSIEEFLAFRA